MLNEEPYLSVVVAARNDDHGGNLLRRMQIFVDGWIGQARRHQLSSELIVVEWNPPGGKPKLSDTLRWPEESGPCEVRFIEVPPELHRRYEHAEALPLYQMIAKNVAIRRARGRFILATNIDILFSNEVMAFLAQRQLRPECMYRIDRLDAMSEVPVDATIDEQLAFCREHLLRINSREGTFPLLSDGSSRSKEETASPSPDPKVPLKVAPVSLRNRALTLWKNLQGLIGRIAENGPVVRVTLPVAPWVRRLAGFYVRSGGVTGLLLHRQRPGRPPEESAAGDLADLPPDIVCATPLHTNACGDFTLVAREHWLALRGYPEFDMYSMNIDSVFCYVAHSAGAREQILSEPMRIYHIEHGAGSGWTPEGQAQLFARLAAKGVPWLPWSDVAAWAEQMRRLKSPMIFNPENWGMADLELEERRPIRSCTPAVPQDRRPEQG